MSGAKTTQPIVLPTPVPVAVGETKLALAAKVLSLVAVIMLLLAMTVALVIAAEERGQIRDTVSARTEELVCRDKATGVLLESITLRDNVLSAMVAAVSVGDLEEAEQLVVELAEYNAQVKETVAGYQRALTDCIAG
jgi:hypothetical protein